MRRSCSALFLLALVLLLGGRADGQGKVGQPAPDFPPGTFSDGKVYSLKDLRGKVVVLYFFEMKAKDIYTTLADRNDLIKSLKDKPIKFLGIGTNATTSAATGVQQRTQLQMPVFADSQGVMEKRYGIKLSTTAFTQARVIAPDGTVAGTDISRKALEALVEKGKVEWKYKGKGYEGNLAGAIDLLEWGQHVQAAKIIAGYRKDLNKKLNESADKLFEDMKPEGEAWKKRADEVAGDEPILAYDLYAKVATVFGGSDLAKSVAEPLKKLGADKDVSKELAARKAAVTLGTTLSGIPAAQKTTAAKLCRDLARKFPDTPTAKLAEELADEISP